MSRTSGRGRRDPHRISWPAAVAWLLVMGAADGLVLGISLAHRSPAGLSALSVLLLAALAWGNRYAP